MELLSALGIDIKILIAQLINFVVLGFILYKIGYKPILKFIQDRTTTIDEGIKNAATAQESLERAKEEYQQIITKAKQEAQAVLTKTHEQAAILEVTLSNKAKEQAEKIVEKAKKDIQNEYTTVMKQARADIAELVMEGTEKILEQKIDKQQSESIIKRWMSEVQ